MLTSTVQIREWLVARIAQRCGVQPHAIDRKQSFARYGLDSVSLAALLAGLGTETGRALPPTLAWEYPSIEALASHIGGERSAPASAQVGPCAASVGEPIAIVGVACRFPRSPDLAAYWRLVREGEDAVTEVPADRWDANRLFHPDRSVPGRMNTRWGAFLDGVADFDAAFFGMSPREAAHTDPQQRLVLELCWEALEDAGIRALDLRGSATGVYFGLAWSDYLVTLFDRGGRRLAMHSTVGTQHGVVANRVSYVLGLNGPSMAVDSACSSSLVAVHVACESLRSGETTLALAGGVHLTLTPETTIGVSKFGALSPDGHCFTFDARANGYVRGEGAGVIVLKPLSRALVDGDRVECLVAGSAVNNDGASNGLTAPSETAQEDLLRTAYQRAGESTRGVQYVEAHGTGTFLGDPIESQALGRVLGQGRPDTEPLLVGSVKTNIGHLEGAAGIAGLIKTVLAIRHRVIPPSLHFETPNPHIPFAELHLEVPRAARPWPRPHEPLVAGVSSFGFGGTNCHVVLREIRSDRVELVPCGAGDPEALKTTLGALLERVHDPQGPTLSELAASAREGLCGAGVPGQRVAITARSHGQLAESVEAILRGEKRRGVAIGAAAGRPPGPVFVFSGLGSQWAGMGTSLLRSEPVFRAALEECDWHIGRYLGWSLISLLTDPSDIERLDRIDIAGASVFAIQIALVALWRSFGIEPAAVVGQSTGEAVAAAAAGVLSVADAMRVVCAQVRLARRVDGQGAMGLVTLGWSETADALKPYEGRLFPAIATAPDSTVVAGIPAALDEFFASLERRKVPCQRVKIGIAPHTPLFDGLRDDLFASLGGIEPHPPRTPIWSTTRIVDGGRLFDAAHWVRNVCDPTLFSRAIAHLVAEGHGCFIEVSPHPIVTNAIVAHRRPGHRVKALPSWRSGEDERAVMLQTMAAAYAAGCPIQWKPAAAPLVTVSAQVAAAGRESVLMVSSKTAEGLRAQSARYAEHLRAHGEQTLEDFCYTAGAGRTAFVERAAVVGRTHAELAEGLDAVARGDERPELSVGCAHEDVRGKLAFVFSGQGSQWVGMGRELWREAPAFHAALEACDAAVRTETGWSVVEALTAWDAARLEAVDVVQPLLWAMGVSLAAEWRALGVEPDAVVGHSLGEVTAATVAGILSMEDGARVICRRSRLVKRLGGRGAMAVVELGEVEAEQAARSAGDGVEVAVINGRRSTVVSGRRPAVEALVRGLEQQGVFCRFVKVDYASHSAEVETLRDELGEALAEVRPQVGRVPLYSTVTGEVEDGHACDAAYWVRNLRQRVRFADVMDRLLGDGYGEFVEVSPHPVLVPAMVEVVGAQGVMTGSLRREQGERRALLEALGRLAVHGHPVDWERLYPGARRVEMPTYAWQRERHWVEAARAEEEGADAGHPLLGRSVISSLDAGTRLWQRTLGGERVAYLQDHRVADTAVMPAAGYLEMGLAAGTAVSGDVKNVELSDVRFEQALGLAAEGGPCVQTALSEEGRGTYGFRVSSPWGEGEKTGWTVHASGRVRVGDMAGPATAESLEEVRQRCATELSAGAFYKAVAAHGLEYGPAFQSVAEVWRGDKEAIAHVRLPQGVNEADRYAVHPALLDGCLQVIAAAAGDGVGNGGGTWMPVGVEGVRVNRRGVADGWCHARWQGEGEDGRGELVLYDETGMAWGEMRGVRLQEVARGEGKPEDRWWLSEAWEPCEPVAERTQPAGRWAVVAEAGAWADAVAEALQERGADVERLGSDASVGTLAARLEEGGGGWRGVMHLAGDGSEMEVPQQVQQACLRALTLVQALGRMTWRDAPRLWLVTCGVQPVGGEQTVALAEAGLWGLGRVIALEHPEWRCTRVDVGRRGLKEEAAALVDELLGDGPEEEIALRCDARLVNRLVTQPPPARLGVERPIDQVQAYRLEIDEPGVLERLALREVLRRPPGPGEVEVAIETAAVNFRDVQLALGVIPAPPETRGWNGPPLGQECAGRIVAVGDEVDGLHPGDLVIAMGDGAFASHMTTRASFVAPWPLGWTAAEAACLPVVFLTAWYALSELARLSRGERVLIHAAAGGVGMAAIQWAHHVGAEVFATAGTPEKRALVESLGVKYVSDSRSLRFVDDVLRWTNGEGVDVVLNSLSGAFIPRSLELLREFGRFVELGVTDYQSNRMLGMRPFLRNISFSLLDLRGMMRGRPARLQQMLQHVVALANDGVFTPLPYRAFPISDVGDGFRFMATGQHTGKIVVTLADPQVRVLTSAAVIGAADATYVISGGLGGLGLVLARWLVERGARHLVLVGRRGAEQTAQAEAVAQLTRAGARVEIARGDIADRAFVARLFDDLQARGRIVRGIVHAAGVLDDALLEQQDGARLARVLAPKVAGAWNLHQLSTRWPLDFFVLYSSAASLVGSPGQSNYAAANAFLDALARHRRTIGLPGLSIAWGAFSEIGLAATQQNRGGRLEGRGVSSLTPDEGLAALDRLLRSDVAQIGVVPFDVRQWIEFFPHLVGSSRFEHLLHNAAGRTAAPAPFRQSLETAPPDKRLPLLTEFLAGQVGRVLGIDAKRLDHRTPLPAMGLDSLMALELRNRIEAGLALRLSAAMLWTYPTIAALAANLSVRLGLVQLESPSAAVAQVGGDKEDNEEVRQFARQLEELGEPELVETFDRYLQGLNTGEGDVNRGRAVGTGGAL